MQCHDVIPLLSRFHDGELAADVQAAVSEHVGSCARCTGKLESLRRLSDLVELTPSPEAPRGLLASVERALAEPSRRSWWPRTFPRPAAAAAWAACAAGLLIGLFLWRGASETTHSHAEMARVFGEFLAAYEEGRQTAPELLPAKYHGVRLRDMPATSPPRHGSIARPVVLKDHRITEQHLIKMPCCDCVQTVYTRDGAVSLVLFEHDKEQPEWFSSRPRIRTQCQGAACSLVQLQGCLAASWPVNGNFVTAIGLRDVTELEQLVSELQSPPSDF